MCVGPVFIPETETENLFINFIIPHVTIKACFALECTLLLLIYILCDNLPQALFEMTK